jgi:hypothetical protein
MEIKYGFSGRPRAALQDKCRFGPEYESEIEAGADHYPDKSQAHGMARRGHGTMTNWKGASGGACIHQQSPISHKPISNPSTSEFCFSPFSSHILDNRLLIVAQPSEIHVLFLRRCLAMRSLA